MDIPYIYSDTNPRNRLNLNGNCKYDAVIVDPNQASNLERLNCRAFIFETIKEPYSHYQFKNSVSVYMINQDDLNFIEIVTDPNFQLHILNINSDISETIVSDNISIKSIFSETSSSFSAYIKNQPIISNDNIKADSEKTQTVQWDLFKINHGENTNVQLSHFFALEDNLIIAKHKLNLAHNFITFIDNKKIVIPNLDPTIENSDSWEEIKEFLCKIQVKLQENYDISLNNVKEEFKKYPFKTVD